MKVLRALMMVCAAAVVVVAKGPLEVTTTYGKIRGVREHDPGVVAFYGIPFARPPVGDLRFKPPQAPESWSDTRDCTHDLYFHVCVQLHITKKIMLGKEDCLYANVYIPDNVEPTESLPIMFWTYGGGYIFGDEYEFGLYRGKFLAASRGVIVVEFNYRLGPLGFIALPELMKESNTTGNYALQDQDMALDFIYENAENFGGDKSKIAIFGESAGGFSVCWHMVNPNSMGKFSAAIMESGSCSSHEFFITLDRAYNFSSNLVVQSNCDTSTDVLGCLRNKSVDDMIIFWNPKGPGLTPPLAPIMPWGPAIDGRYLPALPLDLIKQGKFAKVPFLLGTNHDEGTIFVPFIADVIPGAKWPIDQDSFMVVMRHFFNETTANEVNQFYPLAAYSGQEDRCNTILRDFMFTCAARQTARAMSGFKNPVYLYQFNADLRPWIDYDIAGDYHASELPFVFDHQWPPILHEFNEDKKLLAEGMTTYWTNMAKVGNPNYELPSHVINWPAFNTSTDLNMYLKIPFEVGTHLNAAACDFWEVRKTKY
eukprot:m.108689 g.108689  ORF g.108689 m.108689 type:complete len:538 (+) comp22643_c1_seq1:56-1669(+)